VGCPSAAGGGGFSGRRTELAFGAMDDFHPDSLLAHFPWLAELAQARTLLLNPRTADQGRAALEACMQNSAGAAPEAAETPVPLESDADTFARLLGSPRVETQAAPSSSPLDDFIKQAIAPHVAATPAAWQPVALAAAEMELSARLRAVLHHPEFQALEAAWRGLDLMVQRIVSHEDIDLLVLDVSWAELQADLAAPAPDSALFRLLRDRRPGLLVGNYTFGQTAADLQVLSTLAEVAAGLSTAFVGSAAPALVGCDSFAQHPDPDDWTHGLAEETAKAWATLRASPQAAHIGLTAPRFMLRLPSGKRGSPTDAFAFEELPADPAHETYLWGSASILVACTLIDAIQSGETDLTNFTGGEIGEMPVHLLLVDGEKVAKSFAEAWLTERAAEHLLRAGVIPVTPVKNSDIIRLSSLPSVAQGGLAMRVNG
jgi:type VI secretion system protein ImpC